MEKNNRKRETQKRMLRNGMISNESQDDDLLDAEVAAKTAKAKARKRGIIISMVLIILIAAAVGGIYWYIRYYQYKEASVGWERSLARSETSFMDYVNFGDNLLKFSKDGASYVDASGKDIWIQSYEMSTPIAVTNGDFAAVADQQGNQIYIFDKQGCQGIASTILPIMKVTISAKGVVAAILEDQTASYIYFYQKDGSELQVSIKGLLDGEIGYPLDISLSPDGTLLMGSYMYLDGGALRNRVAFYNFSEVGKNAVNRFVGGFHEMFDGQMIPKVLYLDAVHSVAFSDRSLTFFSSKDVMSPSVLTQIPVKEEIRCVFSNNQYVGLITNSAEGEYDSCMTIYDSAGNEKFTVEFSYDYSKVDIDEDTIFLYNENSCRVYNIYGNLKFEGSFDFSVSKITRGKLPNQILVTGPQAMKELKLR